MNDKPASNRVVRAGLAVVLAIPAAIVMLAIVSLVSCTMVGPWGGALENSSTSSDANDVAAPNAVLVAVFNLSVIMAPLFLGWRWAGRILKRRRSGNR